jgi:AcrR family transcriptional regulator
VSQSGNLQHAVPDVNPAARHRTTTAPSRRDRARATEKRIVQAAYDSFCEHGYAGATMARIAAGAGVAVQTVYFVFHTKAELLRRSYDVAVLGEAQRDMPDKQPWYDRAIAEREVTGAIHEFVSGSGKIVRRLTPLYFVARAAAESDPDLSRVVALYERRRAEGYRDILEVFLAKAPLRDGLDPGRATDLLLLYVGMDAYHALVVDRHWSHDAWAVWAEEMITGLF